MVASCQYASIPLVGSAHQTPPRISAGAHEGKLLLGYLQELCEGWCAEICQWNLEPPLVGSVHGGAALISYSASTATLKEIHNAAILCQFLAS